MTRAKEKDIEMRGAIKALTLVVILLTIKRIVRYAYFRSVHRHSHKCCKHTNKCSEPMHNEEAKEIKEEN